MQSSFVALIQAEIRSVEAQLTAGVVCTNGVKIHPLPSSIDSQYVPEIQQY